MSFETLILRSLFTACTLLCGLILAAMVTSSPAPTTLTTAVIASAPTACALPAGSVACVRALG